MKKLFALVLALVMALSLVACGDKKDDSGDVTAEHTDTTTVAVGAVILARDDVSSDDVYKFVADIFDNAASLTTSHAKYGELSLEYGASITSVPYHPGAAKYFSEKGFEVASVKDGAGNTESRNLRFVTGGESGTYYAPLSPSTPPTTRASTWSVWWATALRATCRSWWTAPRTSPSASPT